MIDKVLFADDEQAILDSYRRIRSGEYQVDIAKGGSNGLAAIKENGPDAIVVSDMRMPVMNGAGFLSQVRQCAPDAFVFIRAFVDGGNLNIPFHMEGVANLEELSLPGQFEPMQGPGNKFSVGNYLILGMDTEASQKQLV